MRYKKEEISALNKIYNAMIALLNEKSYTSINNSQIIKKAEISRSTYYIYFKNKDQIISTICDDTFNHIFNTHLTKEKHHDFSKDHPDELKHIIVHSYYHFLEDRDLVLSILNSGASSIFLRHLSRFMCLQSLATLSAFSKCSPKRVFSVTSERASACSK